MAVGRQRPLCVVPPSCEGALYIKPIPIALAWLWTGQIMSKYTEASDRPEEKSEAAGQSGPARPSDPRDSFVRCLDVSVEQHAEAANFGCYERTHEEGSCPYGKRHPTNPRFGDLVVCVAQRSVQQVPGVSSRWTVCIRRPTHVRERHS